MEPAKERRTRDLDEEHVKNLESQFRTNTALYTVLIGHISEPCELSGLAEAGSAKVEVLGGNHTRQALVNIGADVLVQMDIYLNLREIDALKLGWVHNEIHKFSKHASFEETVKLFHDLLVQMKGNKNLGPKAVQSRWREQICSLTDTTVSTFKCIY